MTSDDEPLSQDSPELSPRAQEVTSLNESDAAAVSAEAVESPTSLSEKQERLPRKLKIGSQRDEESKFAPPSISEAEPHPSAASPSLPPGIAQEESAPPAGAPPEISSELSSFPPPRVEQTTPELEEEIAAALGDLSLDDMLAGEAGNSTEIELGDRRRVPVVKMDAENVFVSLDANREGVASLRQFPKPPVVGEMVEVIVASLSREDGLYELAVPGATMRIEDWDELEEGMVIEARITGHNTGGLECQVGGVAGFIPGGQVALYRVDDFSEYVGQKLTCVVSEVNAERRRLVVSHRDILLREREEAQSRLLEELEEGQVREGIVRKVLDFGAFVDIGGIDGLVHVSKLSWDRVEHPSDVVSEGQKVKVKIEKIDRETGKIGLSIRDTLETPWADVLQNYPVGSIVKGSVTKTTDFGAFVRLAAGIEGLVHISELAHHRVNRVDSVITIGQEIEIKVLSVDPDAQRMSLSLKALRQTPSAPKSGGQAEEDIPPPLPAVEQFQGKLRGGTNRPTGGDEVGLNW